MYNLYKRVVIIFNLIKYMNQRILLFGETGDGKSSFINAFFGKKLAEVSKGPKKCTESVIPITDKRGSEEYTLIDTPGLNDIEKEEEKNKNNIMNTIKEEIKGNMENTIKCILLFRKFQEARLKGSYINALKFLMDLFPFKDFWKHVIIIRSHTNFINDYNNGNEETKKKIDNLFAQKKQLLLDGIKEDQDLKEKMRDLKINIPNEINMEFVDSYDELNDKINDNEYMEETMNNISTIIKRQKPLFKNFNISDKSFYIDDQKINYKEIEYEDDDGIMHKVKKYEEKDSQFSISVIKAKTPPYTKTCKKGKFQQYQNYTVFFNKMGEYIREDYNGQEYEDKAGREKKTQYLKHN